MKKLLSYSATIFALLAALTSCKDKNVPVTEIILNQTTTTREVGSTFTLVATVYPTNATNKGVTWTGDSRTSVDAGGRVTVTSSGQGYVQVKSVDGDVRSACIIVNPKNCSTETPEWGSESLGGTSFKTNETWKVGTMEWSDVVLANSCNKEAFFGGDSASYKADCRRIAEYGDYFSWCAVVRFQDEICPGNWRVPTQPDLESLDKALGGSGGYSASHREYINTWGAVYGGAVYNSFYYGQGSEGIYWTQSQSSSSSYSADYGHILAMWQNSGVYTSSSSSKLAGFLVRCVRILPN